MEFDQINVNDRQTFISFLRLFREDLKNNIGAWENANLEDFLDALERYTQDIQGYYDNSGQLEENASEASWKRFADILKGARIYE